MSANSDPEFDHILDQQLLDGDTPRRGWRRRAVGVPRDQALSEIPKVGTMQTLLPIDPMRNVQTHIRHLGVNQAWWLRRAIARLYEAEGGDPAVAEALQQMERTERSRTVPHDRLTHRGQPRNREGRRRR